MSRAPAGGRCRAVLVLVVSLISLLQSISVRAGVTETGGTVAARPVVETPVATLDRESVPARGRQLALLSVERFGRVAVLARSSQGVSLQIVDRVAGPSAVSGVPGESDGRVEGFLDHGEYRVIARGHEKGLGEARLLARPFKELSQGQPPLLPDLTTVSTTLADFEQRSWWVHVTERRHVAFEVAGRALGDLRLWRDGQWLVDAAPERDTLTPEEGRPLTVLRLAPQLEPGLYLLTAYGGPAEPWARDDSSSPLHVRSGLRELAAAHRQRHVMGPLGIERFSVPGEASYFRLELDESPASLGVGGLVSAAPFAVPDVVQPITKESLPPIAEINAGSRQTKRSLVTVTAPPGKSYILQHFDASHRQPIPYAGRAFVTTIHSGHAADSADATGVLYSGQPRPDGRVAVIAERAIELGGSAAWARRFNLMALTEVYFRVTEAGEYQVDISGVGAECTIEPFLVTRPSEYEPPRPKGSGSTWDLDQGLHVLTLLPREIGIADVAVRAKAGLFDRLLESLGRERPPGVPPLRPSVMIGEVTLSTQWPHFLWIAERPEITSGLVVRAAPVNLATPLPLALGEGESVTIPVTVNEASTLRAELEDGALLAMSLDGAPSADEVLLPAGGEHRLLVTAPPSGGPRNFSIGATPRRASQGLPPLPADLLPKQPDLPMLVAGKPQYLDLAATESRTFFMKATESALYRLETTGLLATEGNVRTRTVTSLARSSSGGTGRNFLVQQYLRSGDYHVTVSALGKSAGHLGLSLKRAAVREGGELEDSVQENVTLPAGEAIAFDLNVPERSTWRLRAVGLGRTLRCRIEEEGGWPIEPPGGLADVTRELDPGHYRLIVLPEPATVKIAASATRVADPVKREGHGPFAFPLGEVVTHQWKEGAAGRERVPDRWIVDMTGTSDVTIAIGAGMEARLAPLGAQEEGLPVTIFGGRPWTGPLGGGRGYAIDVVSSRRDNLRQYTLSVTPARLLPGTSRNVVAPAEIELGLEGATGTPGSSLELTASGASDVRARLVDANGRTVAISDDAPDDWNFRFDDVPSDAARLVIEPVAGERATTTVTMRARSGVMPSSAEAVPLDRTLDLDGDPQLFLLDMPRGDGLLVVTAVSGDALTLEASARSEGGRGPWTSFDRDTGRRASVFVPMSEAPDSWRALVGVRTSRGGKARARLTATIVRPATIDPMLAKDLSLEPVGAAGGGVFAAALPSRQAALFRVDPPRGSSLRFVRASRHGFAPVRRIDGDQLALESNVGGWLVATSRDAAAASAAGPLAIRTTRVILKPGAPAERLRLSRETIACEVDATPERTWRLAVVEAAGAQPLVALDLNGPMNARPGCAWRGGAASAIGQAQVSRAFLRLADGEGSASSPARVFVADLPLVTKEPPASSWSGIADPSIAWKLPVFPRLIRLSLDAGTFAVLTDGWAVRSVHGSTTEAVDETFVPEESTLLHVVRLAGSTGRHAVEVTGPASAAAPVLRVDEGAPFEMLPEHGGRVRVRVQAGRPATLRAIGASGAWLWRGSLERTPLGDGVTLAAGETAMLVLDHSLDPVAAWLDADGASAFGMAGTSPAPVDVVPPASVALAGAAMTLRVRSAEPALLSLRTAQAVVARVRRPGGAASESRAWPRGARIDAWVPAGVTEIDVRGFASTQLAGQASVELAPGVELAEGVGETAFVPAGSARGFAFSLMRAARVGLGVRAGSDAVSVRLLDGAGTLLGTGIVQMHELEAGRYVLVVSAPAADGPVAVRPVLLGLDERGSGPPPEAVRGYVLAAAPPPENAAPRAPDWHRWLGVQAPRGEEAEREGRPETEGELEGESEETFSEEGD